MAAVIKEAVDINEGGGSLKAAPRRSGRSISKKVVDLTLYWVFCALAGTGLLLAYRLPHGAGNVGAVTFLGHRLHDWGVVHTWLAYAALCLLVIHLVLNREWLVKIAASKRAWRLVVPVFCGILLIGVFVLLPLERRGSPARNLNLQLKPGLREPGANNGHPESVFARSTVPQDDRNDSGGSSAHLFSNGTPAMREQRPRADTDLACDHCVS